jgi:uncharacterized membrane protein
LYLTETFTRFYNIKFILQAAHVGIGIAGEEGLQAVMASDYVLARFRFLSRLLIVHGKWSYRRISEMIFNYFYKNNLWVGILFWYVFYSGYSTQTVYEFTYMLFYNLLFSSLPVMVMGVFDQDVDANISMLLPSMYTPGINRYWFSLKRFTYYMVEGVYQSLICYFIPLYAYESGSTMSDGKSDSINTIGTTMAIAAITNVNLFVGLNSRNWTCMTFFAVIASILLIHIYLLFYSYQTIYDTGLAGLRGVPEAVYTSLVFWCTIILCIVLAMLPRVLLFYIQNNYMPMDMDIAREVQKYNLDRSILNQPKPTAPSPSIGDLSVFRSRAPSLQASPKLTMLNTGVVVNNRGFVFSHEVGMRDIMMGSADASRRRSFELPPGWRSGSMPTVRRYRTLPSLYDTTSSQQLQKRRKAHGSNEESGITHHKALSDPAISLAPLILEQAQEGLPKTHSSSKDAQLPQQIALPITPQDSGDQTTGSPIGLEEHPVHSRAPGSLANDFEKKEGSDKLNLQETKSDKEQSNEGSPLNK